MAAQEGIMELLWQNGQVVVQVQSQNQRGVKKSHMAVDTVMPPAEPPLSVREMLSDEGPLPPQLFMQEDEMPSWLHYHLDDSTFDSRDLFADLLYPATTAPPSRTDVRISPPPPSLGAATAPRPPIPIPIPVPRRADAEGLSPFQNSMHFLRSRGRVDSSGPSSASKAVRESSTTVVDSNETPAAALELESKVSNAAVDSSTAQISGVNLGFRGLNSAAGPVDSTAGGTELATTTCELTVTSSPGGSGASASENAEPPQKQAEDRKRKGKETDDAECHNEDVDFESLEAEKQVRGSTSTKRSRAAEVHNLSERRRRDRINEKMRALQELIPRCNKSDKASMLAEAIEYLKSLQLQVQMMSMGCSMVPVVYPGVQQYMPPMGMGMGMAMGMNRPMVPFPPVLPGSALPNPAAAAHLGPRCPMPAFHMEPVHVPDASRMQATGESEPLLNSSQPWISNFTDPYQQYVGLHQTQLPPRQNQMMQPSSGKPSSNGAENPENRQSG